MALEIKILGPGCIKCKTLKRHTLKAVESLAKETPEIAVTVQSVSELSEILRYDILGTPALVINERIIAVGKVLRTEEILAHLRAASAEEALPTTVSANA